MLLQDDKFATFKLFKTELAKKGYRTKIDLIGGKRFVTYTSPNGRFWSTYASRVSYPFVDHEARRTALHKDQSYKLAQQLKVQIPYTVFLQDDEALEASQIRELFAAHPKMIVKPSSSSMSRGLSLNITNKKELQAAIDEARTVGRDVIIQEQVDGEEIRFVVLNGKIIAALLRRSARVTGDGSSTVAQMIAKENKDRMKIHTKMVKYPQLDASNISKHFLTDKRVLEAGELLELNRATMIKKGSSVYDVLDQIHPGYMKIVSKLANALDPSFIVVDVFIKEFGKAPRKGQYWFNEFNTSPSLKLCYGCRDGKMLDILPLLAGKIDEYLHDETVYPDPVAARTVGGFELVNFPGLHAKRVLAKVDTGAYSGAIHCTFIESVRSSDGLRVLRFQPFSSTNEIIETSSYKKTFVRSSTGHRVKRYIVETEIDIKGKRYMIRTGLSDRRDMQTQVLVGRRFLRAYGLLVDVTLNEELDNDGGGKH